MEKYLQQNKVCNWCYGKIDDGKKHGVERNGSYSDLRCALKKRLKCAIKISRKRISYEEHIRRIHSSRDSFVDFLSNLDLDLNAPTK